ncbi:MAG: hypothetical protein H0T51_14535 [Pirellulales bacterium]|nr:hypothetical protein [Pirellulales bacterium]
MRASLNLLAAAAVVVACGVRSVEAEEWQATAGGFWSDVNNWLPQSVPNAVGATAEFTNPTTGVDFVTIDGQFTVGTLLFDLTGSTGNNDHRLIEDTFFPGGTLTLDDADSQASITVQGTGIPNVDLSIPLILNDNVVMDVATLTAQSAAGALSIDGTISGSGGVTKTGVGTLTYITGAKTYTGPTEFQAGKVRLRGNIGVPTASSSVRILDGAWIEPSSGLTNLQFGAGTLFLNGDGATDTFSAPGGAIRPERSTTSGAVLTIPNNIVLETNSSLHLQTQNDTTLGSMTLSGIISGPGQLQLTHFAHNEQIGSYILTNDNSYTGGTELRAGTLRLSGATADLGTGDVNILDGRFLADRVTVINGAATSRLLIESGVTNAIADDATLTLGGGFVVANKAGFAELGAGISETVGGLILGATAQTLAGTYGATGSGATFIFDEFFTGTGVINLVLPPADDADFDGDGDVDGADFLTWQQGLGLTGAAATNAAGNANGDSVIDGADLTVWRNSFGQPAIAAVGAVPEPGAVLLALLAAPLGLLARRRR